MRAEDGGAPLAENKGRGRSRKRLEAEEEVEEGVQGRSLGHSGIVSPGVCV